MAAHYVVQRIDKAVDRSTSQWLAANAKAGAAALGGGSSSSGGSDGGSAGKHTRSVPYNVTLLFLRERLLAIAGGWQQKLTPTGQRMKEFLSTVTSTAITASVLVGGVALTFYTVRGGMRGGAYAARAIGSGVSSALGLGGATATVAAHQAAAHQSAVLAAAATASTAKATTAAVTAAAAARPLLPEILR